jgi:hypothetical protein
MAKKTVREAASGETNEALDVVYPFDLGAVVNFNHEALETMSEMNQAVLKRLVQYNEEIAEFANKRLKEDMAVPQKLMACGSTHDIFNYCMTFCQDAAQQYLGEAQRLATLGGEMTGETFDVFEKAVDKAGLETDAAREAEAVH